MHREAEWRKLPVLNSLTKFPSILTYHKVGAKNRLTDEIQVQFPDEPLYCSEKIHGCNARIIVERVNGGAVDNRWNIYYGSREEILHIEGDRYADLSYGIVETLRSIFPAPQPEGVPNPYDDSIVFYFEVYGHGTTQAAKEYTKAENTGALLLAAQWLPAQQTLQRMLKHWDKETAGNWRRNGNQDWLTPEETKAITKGSAMIPVYQDVLRGEDRQLPTTHEGAVRFLNWIQGTKTGYPLEDCLGGVPEGVVLRTRSGSHWAKLRYEDYLRTMELPWAIFKEQVKDYEQKTLLTLEP